MSLPAVSCPDTNANSFVGERHLTSEQKEILRHWAEQGAPEGESTESSSEADWSNEWSLGEPDFVVSFDQPFEVPAGDEDIYRKFVIPIPVRESKFVDAIEIRPSNRRVAHHMFVRIDRTGAAMALSGKDGQPGFGGMTRPSGVQAPQGCILSWQVGKQPSREPEGIAWQLEPNSHFVIECHIQPTGKKELLDLEIGLHFTETPPTRMAVLANLRQLDIDIPAGQSNYQTTMEYTLPVPALATAVLPHAHYLGRRMEGFAVLPSGEKKVLIRIPEWNFNWQGEYRYKDPLLLPAGTKIVMDYQYDNSAANPLNPNHPPQRVKYGPETKDEMSELAIQLIPTSPTDFKILSQDVGRWRITKELIPHNLRVLADESTTPVEEYRMRLNLSKAYITLGNKLEAQKHLGLAIKSPEASATAFSLLGRLSVTSGDLSGGTTAFRRALQLDPNHLDALNGLGLVAMQEKRYRDGVGHFQEVVRLNPYEATAYYNLGICHVRLGDGPSAITAFEGAVKQDTNHQKARKALVQLRQVMRNRLQPNPNTR